MDMHKKTRSLNFKRFKDRVFLCRKKFTNFVENFYENRTVIRQNFYRNWGIIGSIIFRRWYNPDIHSDVSFPHVYSIKSVHHQILVYGGFFLLGTICPVIFFHTHFAKEYLKKIYSGYLHIYIGGHHFRLKALVDTGNRLYEPLTGKPVCLVEYNTLKAFMREQSKPPFRWAIPYHTIGKTNGMLWGLTADKLIFQNQWQKIRKSGCIIAIYPGKISKSGDICAIVHPDILKK